jgi:hypothetical protein
MTPPKKTTMRFSEAMAFLSFIFAVHFPHAAFITLAFSWILLYLGVLLKKF